MPLLTETKILRIQYDSLGTVFFSMQFLCHCNSNYSIPQLLEDETKIV